MKKALLKIRDTSRSPDFIVKVVYTISLTFLVLLILIFCGEFFDQKNSLDWLIDFWKIVYPGSLDWKQIETTFPRDCSGCFSKSKFTLSGFKIKWLYGLAVITVSSFAAFCIAVVWQNTHKMSNRQSNQPEDGNDLGLLWAAIAFITWCFQALVPALLIDEILIAGKKIHYLELVGPISSTLNSYFFLSALKTFYFEEDRNDDWLDRQLVKTNNLIQKPKYIFRITIIVILSILLIYLVSEVCSTDRNILFLPPEVCSTARNILFLPDFCLSLFTIWAIGLHLRKRFNDQELIWMNLPLFLTLLTTLFWQFLNLKVLFLIPKLKLIRLNFLSSYHEFFFGLSFKVFMILLFWAVTYSYQNIIREKIVSIKLDLIDKLNEVNKRLRLQMNHQVKTTLEILSLEIEDELQSIENPQLKNYIKGVLFKVNAARQLHLQLNDEKDSTHSNGFLKIKFKEFMDRNINKIFDVLGCNSQDCSYQLRIDKDLALNVAKSSAISRIIAEAMMNSQMAYHNNHIAQIDRIIQLKIVQEESQLLFEILDNAGGIPEGPLRPNGYGIRYMKEEVEHLEGEFKISNKNNGTLVQFSIPIN